MRRDDSEPCNLRDGQIDEDDAARQHLLTKWHVREHDQDAGHERRPQYAQLRLHAAHFAPASSRLMVSWKRAKRSLASGVPPTVYGSSTTGTWMRSDSQSAALGSL